MKTITRLVNIQNKNFVLIQMEEKDIKPLTENNKFIIGMYGTISYDLIDKNGKLTRKVNCLEMCIADTISKAIELRNDQINTEQFNELPMDQYLEKIGEYYKNKRLQGAR